MNANITVARVAAANLAIVSNVADDVFDDEINIALLETFVADPTNLLFVAIRDNVVVGQVQAHVHAHLHSAPELYIDNLGVTPEQQRQRIATELLHAVLDQGRVCGCATAWIVTEPDNEAANGVYRSLDATHSDVAMYTITIS